MPSTHVSSAPLPLLHGGVKAPGPQDGRTDCIAWSRCPIKRCRYTRAAAPPARAGGPPQRRRLGKVPPPFRSSVHPSVSPTGTGPCSRLCPLVSNPREMLSKPLPDSWMNTHAAERAQGLGLEDQISNPSYPSSELQTLGTLICPSGKVWQVSSKQ